MLAVVATIDPYLLMLALPDWQDHHQPPKSSISFSKREIYVFSMKSSGYPFCPFLLPLRGSKFKFEKNMSCNFQKMNFVNISNADDSSGYHQALDTSIGHQPSLGHQLWTSAFGASPALDAAWTSAHPLDVSLGRQPTPWTSALDVSLGRQPWTSAYPWTSTLGRIVKFQ